MAAPHENNRTPRWVGRPGRSAAARTTVLTRVSVLWGMVLAAGKLVMGLSVASVFLCLHAFYTACMGLARWLFLRVQTGGRPFGLRSEHGCCPAMGGIVLAASAFYMLYSLRLFLGQPSPRYHRYAAIAIAVFTLAEIALNVYGSVTARRREEPLLHALRLTNLAASLICIPLAQAAVLSFTHAADLSFYNGLSGLIFGAFAAIIGAWMLFHRPKQPAG